MERLALQVANAITGPERSGLSVVAFQSPNRSVLIDSQRNRRRPQTEPGLAGSRMPAVNDVGEPCAEEPPARFDGRALETG